MAAFRGHSTILNKLVSSANSLVLLLMALTISFMKITNKMGHRIDP